MRLRDDELLQRAAAVLGATALHRTRDALDSLCERLGARLPHLYELLILDRVWCTGALGPVELLANPPGEDFAPLLSSLAYDPTLFAFLVPRGLVPVARPRGGDFDPVCFDLRRVRGRDAPLVRIDHEGVLSFGRPRLVEEVAPSFRTLLSRA